MRGTDSIAQAVTPAAAKLIVVRGGGVAAAGVVEAAAACVALERLAREHENEDVVIVSHGGTIRAAVATAKRHL